MRQKLEPPGDPWCSQIVGGKLLPSGELPVHMLANIIEKKNSVWRYHKNTFVFQFSGGDILTAISHVGSTRHTKSALIGSMGLLVKFNCIKHDERNGLSKIKI